MSKFKKDDAVIWHDEICKVIEIYGPVDLTQYIYSLKNYHRNETIKAKESELRKPKPGEFLESSSSRDSEKSNGAKILTKVEEVSNDN